MSRFVLAALLLAATAAQSQTLQPAGSEIVFVSKQMGVPVEGRFQRFSLPGFSFDPKKPEAAKVAIQIDLRSASMGAADVEAELAKPEWFDSKRQPNASFTAQSVKALGGGRFGDVGDQQLLELVHRTSLPGGRRRVSGRGGTRTWRRWRCRRRRSGSRR